jgi:general secretion pathway protein H
VKKSRGRLRHPACAGLRPSLASGFTLIEILVVLVIVGVLAAALLFAAGGSGPRELENAARRAQALIAVACERAVIGGRDIGFAPVEGGLRFGYFELDGWHELPDRPDDELRPRALGAGIALEARQDGEVLPLAPDAPEQPPFACLASGELTPFTLRFTRAGVDDAWQLDARLDGSLELALLDAARR